MLMASYIYFDTKAGVNLFGKAKGKLFIGDHPNVSFLRDIDINPDPYFTLFNKLPIVETIVKRNKKQHLACVLNTVFQ